jgi:hypothetical protein
MKRTIIDLTHRDVEDDTAYYLDDILRNRDFALLLQKYGTLPCDAYEPPQAQKVAFEEVAGRKGWILCERRSVVFITSADAEM